MERVETLCNRLLEQLALKASPDALLMTVQMLQSELLHLKATGQPEAILSAVAIDVPVAFEMTGEMLTNNNDEEKIIEVLQVDEAEVEAELEEIKRNAEAKNSMSAQNKPAFVFDALEETPTLTQQRIREPKKPARELHESIGAETGGSLNEKLKQTKIELSETLQEIPVKDLKKAIGINDRFLYINELFRGDEVMYERSIKTINGFSIYPEAEYWIKRELKLKLGWDEKTTTVKQFDQLVRRRFSVI